MKVASTTHGMVWHLRKLVFFGLEHNDAHKAIDASEAVVGVAALFCATSILILLFL